MVLKEMLITWGGIMSKIFKGLQEILKDNPEVDLINAYELFSISCERIYTKYIKKDGVIIKHYLSDETLDNEALELTSRYLRMWNYKRKN